MMIELNYVVKSTLTNGSQSDQEDMYVRTQVDRRKSVEKRESEKRKGRKYGGRRKGKRDLGERNLLEQIVMQYFFTLKGVTWKNQ